MDYIKQLNAFELWLETNYLPSVSQLIWYKLFMLFNRCGWVEWVTVDNCRLMVLADIKSETTLINNRDKLIAAGLIEFKKGKKGTPNRYKMVRLYTSEYTPKNEVNTELNQSENKYTPKNGANTELIRSENASQNGAKTLDINKLNKTKLNKTNNIHTTVSGNPTAHEQIIAHLNRVCGTAFKPNTKTTKQHINARLKEGFTLDDFIAVIDKKFFEWGKRPDMAQYLRPQTLFGSNFEGYLNQPWTDGRKANPTDIALRNFVSDSEPEGNENSAGFSEESEDDIF